MTFEQDSYRLRPDEVAMVRAGLAAEGIYWYPLKYHKGLPLAATAFDCLCGVLAGIWITLRHRPRVVHSRASIPAVIALTLSRLCGLKFLYDADSRLSDEYADNGHWTRDSLAYRLTSWFERKARDSADSIVTLTERLRGDFLDRLNVQVPITVIPCCVALESKYGPRYLLDEMLGFFRSCRAAMDNRSRLLIVTGDSACLFHEAAGSVGLARDDYSVLSASHDQIADWLSAADVGLAFIRSAECERGSSPVKIGEYLAVGLPVVVTSGIGDYSELIETYKAGVVVDQQQTDEWREAAVRLNSLLSESSNLRSRIRGVAESHVSLESVGAARYEAVYSALVKGVASTLKPVEESR
jgi:glycosyltransferase involved in cell wall biosynthesis